MLIPTNNICPFCSSASVSQPPPNSKMSTVRQIAHVLALIYAINVAAINAIKYFNAVNATLFTSGIFPDTKPPRACSQSARRDRVEDGES